MSSFAARIDHVVITVGERLDEAQRRYERLGFALTQRGHHSLGSSNHLAIFRQDYLELLGYEPGRGRPRPALWQDPPGLTGLAFKPPAEVGALDLLRAEGLPIDPEQSFNRPVRTSEGERLAKFRTATYAHPGITNGRVFFCHHETPKMVWRDEWRGHANGVTGIAEIIIAARDPSYSATAYADLFGLAALRSVSGGVTLATDTAVIRILTPDCVAESLGSAPEMPEHGDRMVALALFTPSPQALLLRLSQNGFAGIIERDNDVVVPADAAEGVALIFRKAAG